MNYNHYGYIRASVTEEEEEEEISDYMQFVS